MRYLVLTIILVSLIVTPASADDKTEVDTLVRSNIDKIVTILQDASIVKSVRNDRILAIVNPLFNYQTMAKLSLGKKHWPGLTNEQQNEFTKLFTMRLQESYLEKLDIYSDEAVRYGEPQVQGNKAYAPTALVAEDNEIDLLYKFYRSAEGWKIYDIEIAGVSVIQTYRTQFDSVLNNGTADDLLDKLKEGEEFTVPGSEKS